MLSNKFSIVNRFTFSGTGSDVQIYQRELVPTYRDYDKSGVKLKAGDHDQVMVWNQI